MSYDNSRVQKDVDELIKRKASELGISVEQAYELYRCPFVFMIDNWGKAEKDKAETFESTYIKGIGVFYPKIDFIKRLKEKHEATSNGK